MEERSIQKLRAEVRELRAKLARAEATLQTWEHAEWLLHQRERAAILSAHNQPSIRPLQG